MDKRKRSFRKRWNWIPMLLIGCLLFGAVAQPDAYGADAAEEAVNPQLQELLEGLQDITAGEGDVTIEHSTTGDPAAEGQVESEPGAGGSAADGQLESDDTASGEEEEGLAEENAVLANVSGGLYKASSSAGGVSTGDSQTASVSGDGAKFAFASKASNLVDGDTNGYADIFLHDRGSGTTKRINLGPGGQQADNHSYLPVISLDGRFVLFTSKAQNMPGNTSGLEDLYLYDDQKGSIEKIFDNVQASLYGAAGSPFQMSADGRYIAFAGPKPNSFSGWEVMVKDRVTGNVQQASDQVFVFGQPPLPRVSISADGRYVVFDSYYKSLVSGDTNERSDIFLYDTKRESLKRISVSAEGAQGNGDSRFPFISADGRYVAYQSYASNLAPGDTDAQQDVLVYDRLTGLTEVASYGSDGVKGKLSSNDATISADGRFVAFHTDNAFDPADTGVADVYVRDRALGRTFWASRAASGGSGDQWSVRAFISADGRTVAFESHAANLLDPADTDGFYDIYAAALPDPGTSAPAWSAGAELTASRLGATYIGLSWPAAEGAAHYRIYRNGALEAITSEASYVSAGLAPEATYSFRVQAGSADFVWSAAALELTENTSAQPETEAPGQASNVQGAPIPGGMRVTWQDPDDLDVTGVKLQWRKAGGEPRETPMFARGDEWAEVPGLMNRTAYEFRVLAYDGDGNMSASEWAGATTGAGPRVERVNVRPGSGKMSASDIDESSMSDDGRYIVFATDAADIAARDDNREQDVFLYDRELGRTSLISRALGDGGTTANGASSGAKISGNGRFIVFGSGATNLTAAPDTNKNWDVFLHDRDPDQNGVFDEEGVTLTKITLLPDGAQTNGGSWQPTITTNGDSILFMSRARNLTPDAPDDYHYIRYERADRSFTRLTLADGTTPELSNGAISGDGSHAVFATLGENAPGDENGKQDIYAYAFATKELTWISKFPEGFQRGWASTYDMSEDARYIVFGIGELENRMGGVFLVDREAAAGATPQSVVVPYDGRSPMGYSEGASISDDGRYVAFTSNDQTLVKGDTNAQADVFVRDLVKGTNIRATLPHDPAQQGNDSAVRGDLSGDGRWMTFQSSANNFVTGELRKQLDLFVTSVETAEPAAAAWPAGSALTVTAASHDSLTVSWTAAERATAYRIHYGGVVKDAPNGATTAKLTGLEPDTAYELKVEASSGSGTWTTDGPTASARTMAVPTLAELKLSLPASGGVRLEWDPPAAGRDIASLAVMRREGDQEPVQLAALEDVTVRSYTDETAQAGKTYRYALVAKDSSGISAPYTHERGITVRTLAVTGVHYVMPLYANTYAGLGDRVDFGFMSEPGAEASGTIVYETTGGATRELAVSIKAEGVTGRYKGSVTIPGDAARLLSAEVSAEKDGQRARSAVWREAIPVGGSLQIHITGNRTLAQQAILTVQSVRAEAARTTRPGASGTLLLKGLAPAEDYAVTLNHPESGDLLLDAPPAPVKVSAGTRTTVGIEPEDTVRVTVTARTPSNLPAGGAKVTMVEPGSGRSYTAVTNGSGQAQFGGLPDMDGRTVRLRVEAGSDRLLPAEITSKLARGMNNAAIELPWNANAVVRGTVTGQGGEKIAGATVTIRQGDGIFSSLTDREGRYEARVLRGEAAIQASIPPYTHGPWISKTMAEGVNDVPLHITEQLPSKVEVELFTRAAGGAWIGPHEIDWRTFVHYHIDSSHLLLSRSNPLVVKANPGEKVRICADGLEAGMPLVCGEAVISAERTGQVELWLEESGAAAVADWKEPVDPEAPNTWKMFGRERNG
ncbi:fibronectin type III domain-containing protein, partial [Paenibacillus xanthanilyticus]